MTRKFKLVLSLVMVALFMVSTAVFATVSFDPATGTGFVGRGDIITALGKSALEGPLSFTYEDELVLSQLCERDGNRGVVQRSFTRSRSISGTVAHETRRNSQQHITGYYLTGYSSTVSAIGAIPTDICPDPNDNPAQEKWAPAGDVQIVSATGGALKVNGVPLQ